MITIPLILDTMRKPWMRCLGRYCREKAFKNSKGFKNLEKIVNISLKIADIKILKNIPLHLEPMQYA